LTKTADKRRTPNRAKSRAAAAARANLESGFVVDNSSPAGCRAVFFSCAARTRAGLDHNAGVSSWR
jgi:hypothetical protein